MRSILSERNIVIALFVLVFITFSMAHEDSKKLEQKYLGTANSKISPPGPVVKSETRESKQQDYIFVLPSSY